MLDLEDDNALRRLCYLIALLLVVVPLFQAAGGTFGAGQTHDVRWRLGATNNFIQAMLLPYVGMGLFLVIARAVKDNGPARAVGVLSALTAAGIAGASGLFVLDSLQVKTIVSSREMASFNLALIRVAVILAAFFVAFAVLAYVAFKPPYGQQRAPVKGTRKPAPDEPVGFLIGQDLSK